MPWARLDDNFPDHVKVIEAGPLACWLHVCGICYSARQLTDGYIPRAYVFRLASVENPLELVQRLVDVGLWHEVENGYQIHDYLEYNPSAAQVKAKREANAKRQASWRERHRKSNGQYGRDVPESNGVTNAVTNAQHNTAPSHPIPTTTKNKGADAPASFDGWLKALRAPSDIGEKNGIAVLVRMGQALYPNFPADKSIYGRVGKLARQAGSQSKLASVFWEHASKPLAAPLDYLQAAVNGKARDGGPPPPKMRTSTAGGPR